LRHCLDDMRRDFERNRGIAQRPESTGHMAVALTD
jgi:hypothetical protein